MNPAHKKKGTLQSTKQKMNNKTTTILMRMIKITWINKKIKEMAMRVKKITIILTYKITGGSWKFKKKMKKIINMTIMKKISKVVLPLHQFKKKTMMKRSLMMMMTMMKKKISLTLLASITVSVKTSQAVLRKIRLKEGILLWLDYFPLLEKQPRLNPRSTFQKQKDWL